MNPEKMAAAPEGGERLPQSGELIPSDVYSSYIFTTSNRKISKYGERLFMEVISAAKEYLIDAALGFNSMKIDEEFHEKYRVIEIPIRNLLDVDDTTNYTAAKKAAIDLMGIYHTVESPVMGEDGRQKTYRDGKPQYKFSSYHLLEKVDVNEKPGIVTVKLGETTWAQILDMGRGYTRYNLLAAKKLENEVAIRMFQILSNSREPLRFTLERIKTIFGYEKKYSNNPSGFIARVIEPAVKEINEKCSFRIKYERVFEKEGLKGSPYIIGLVFRKKSKIIFETELEKLLGSELFSLLKEFGFTTSGIQSNTGLFRELIEGGVDVVKYIRDRENEIRKADSPPGYIISLLKNFSMETVSGKGRLSGVPGKEGSVTGESGVRKRGRRSSDGRLLIDDAESFADSGMEEL